MMKSITKSHQEKKSAWAITYINRHLADTHYCFASAAGKDIGSTIKYAANFLNNRGNPLLTRRH